MTNSDLGKRLNKVMCNTLDGHWPFNAYQITINFSCMVTYYVVDNCLRFKDKIYNEGYEGVVYWKSSYMTFGL